MSGRNRDAVQLLARVETDVAAPRRARHNYAMALLADNQRMRAVRLLRLDMAAVEAEQLANEFAASIAAMPGQRGVNALRLPDPTESQLRRLLPSPAAPELPSSPAAAVPEPPTATPPAGVTREELPPVVAPAAAPAAAPPMADRSRRKA